MEMNMISYLHQKDWATRGVAGDNKLLYTKPLQKISISIFQMEAAVLKDLPAHPWYALHEKLSVFYHTYRR